MEFIKTEIGKGKISSIKIERTPIGEKIIVKTSRPGLVIGRKGEAIQSLTAVLKEKFKLENPKLEILEIEKPEFDAQTAADQIAMSLERFGPNSFKIIAYRTLERIKKAAEGTSNLIPPILNAVKAYASIGEICDVLREVFGEWQGDRLI